MKEKERKFWHFMITTSVVLNVLLILAALTLWIWGPKAWAFSVWIAICIVGGWWDSKRNSSQLAEIGPRINVLFDLRVSRICWDFAG